MNNFAIFYDQSAMSALVDRNEIAHLLGVGPTAVSNYVARTNVKHPPFPDPVLVRGLGRFRLWLIEDVINWYGDAFPNRSGTDLSNYPDRLAAFRATNGTAR